MARGRGTKKVSEYGLQLREKQKAKQAYGLREAQFRRYFQVAAKNRAQTGPTLFQLLERRLDNVVFRAGLSLSRAHARQLVSHRHFLLNGKRVSLPSILVKTSDKIEPVTPKKFSLRSDATTAGWLKVDKKKLTVTVASLPESADLPAEYDSQKIVEFYSR